MSLMCKKSFRCICLTKRVTNTLKVCPLLSPTFCHKFVGIKLFKTIPTTTKDTTLFNHKVVNQIHSNYYSNDVNRSQNCWKCGHEWSQSKVLLFCDNCHSIQAIDGSLNYFDLFEQKVSFDLDLNKLHQRFKSLQMSTHPDKYVMSSDTERKYSSDNSLLINFGYKTLRDPYERGLYLLKLFNSFIKENQSMGL